MTFDDYIFAYYYLIFKILYILYLLLLHIKFIHKKFFFLFSHIYECRDKVYVTFIK